MEEIVIENISDYLQIVEGNVAFIYRGVSHKEYKLIPSIARGWVDAYNNKGLKKTAKEEMERAETNILDDFKAKAIGQLDYNRPSTNWEWLMLGQHYGLKTRLLDWSHNPLVALYFSLGKDNELRADGAVYTLSGLEPVKPDKTANPFRITKDY